LSVHELTSSFLYIHPPLAIIADVLTFLFALLVFMKPRQKRVKTFGLLTWIFALLGLVTGMLWAQLAWGSYWSWDPKETFTLLYFLSISASLATLYEKKLMSTKWLSVISCILAVVTLLSSFIIAGLHSFSA
jgi:ABC-type transport system involved in cytochrome c biogenesis permease subunit